MAAPEQEPRSGDLDEHRGGRSAPRGASHQPDPVISLSSADYLATSLATPCRAASVVPKLLVLDLNGALLYRSQPGRKRICARPYLRAFLEYIFLPAPTPATARPYDVFVWSSAQPHNVRTMVDKIFGPTWGDGVGTLGGGGRKTQRDECGTGRLRGVWARDQMGLSAEDYGRKAHTTKDLRKVIVHLGDARFDECTTVLLDDSPLKAVHQPWSHIVLPEYGPDACRHSAAAARAARLEDDQVNAAEPDSRSRAVDSCDKDDNVQHADVATDARIASAYKSDMDRTLLSIVGILDALRKIDNVPAWVRAGGLLRRHMPVADVSSAELPANAGHERWYVKEAVCQAWLDEGVSALMREGIRVEHGLEELGGGTGGTGYRGATGSEASSTGLADALSRMSL